VTVGLVFTIAVLICSPGGCLTVTHHCSQYQAWNNSGSWRERGLWLLDLGQALSNSIPLQEILLTVQVTFF